MLTNLAVARHALDSRLGLAARHGDVVARRQAIQAQGVEVLAVGAQAFWPLSVAEAQCVLAGRAWRQKKSNLAGELERLDLRVDRKEVDRALGALVPLARRRLPDRGACARP